ncbi:hypothetical protein BP6252_00052 [Coleophoma cylindrospora]|uniref:SMP-30/Gluconolactonase/LRE-like region domain-containing protein n=1 Tax=Coleophoma cylindrospora TaxID=1849047 RepID=A0A3D8SNX8_9HELO|nr:hypothetical protein BP6252_00052 [Coleophoma cylindrospora]
MQLPPSVVCLVVLARFASGISGQISRQHEPRVETTYGLPLTVNTIYEGPVPTWNENLAVRTNGQILVTRLDSPVLELIDPAVENAVPVTVATFSSDYAGLLGITETNEDVFYVVAAAPFGSDFVKTSGNSSIFQIDMTQFAFDSATSKITGNATITKVVDMPDAGFLNGMTTIDPTAGLVFIADAYNGWVYSLDVTSGEYKIAIDDAKMKYLPSSITNLGVNGLKIRDNYLYFSNSGNPIFCRIPINTLGEPTGPSEIVADIRQVDDFVFRSDGVAFMCQNQIESLSAVSGSEVVLVAGSNTSTLLAGVTAGAFGRSEANSNILYLTTDGGLAIPVNGSVIVGGKIAWIDTEQFSGIGT